MDAQEIKSLSANYLRRFGAEIEINSMDGRNRPLGGMTALPDGIHYVGELVRKTTNSRVLLHKWDHDHHNDCWVVKPDSSCGMEVCSPVSKGWYGLKRICEVVEALSVDGRISADQRCSLHVHVEVADLMTEALGAVIAWWVKCEPVFFDSVPSRRKRNRYCQGLGLNDLFDHNSDFSPEHLIKRVGICKYFSMNSFHLRAGKRQTIEFRIMENDACVNAYMTKNWVRLLIHFVEMASKRKMPLPYQKGDIWTGWVWLEPREVMEVLGFAPGQCKLSPGLEQTRTWFLGRLWENVSQTGLPGPMSDAARKFAKDQIKSIILELGLQFLLDDPSDMKRALYGEEFKV